MVASNNNLRQDVDKTRVGIGAGGGGWGRQGLKKGPWTTAEDAILMEYVRKHGEGNWNAVQRNCGLLRCGKSCRLRWANHLRPNLKKGSFTPDEEGFIIELHSKIGNKWAKMASQLPGRTDNEIKNYWNTRVKRLQRAGLPIYPDDIPYYQNKHPSDQVQPQKTNPNSQTQYSNHKFNPSFSLLNPVLSFPTMVTYPPFLSHPNHSYQNFFNKGNLSNLPLPSSSGISTFSSPQSSILDKNFHMAGSLSQCNGLLYGPEKAELPSIQVQTRVKLAGTPASSVTSSGGDCMIGRQSEAAQHPFCTLIDSNEIETVMENSGLLETLLEESNALVQALKFKKETSFDSGQGKEDASNTCGPDSTSHHSSCGGKEEALIEVMNSMDDDLSSLLNNFPLSVPVPDWYDASSTATSTVTVTTSNGQSSNIVNKIQNSGLHENETTSINNPKRSTSLDSCCWSWNNMPGIC